MKKIILAMVAVMVPLMLSAGSTDFWFRHFSVEDGLSSSAVRAIMQDKYGFMWLGTDDGLNRYDGTTIKIYRLNPEGVNDYETGCSSMIRISRNGRIMYIAVPPVH